VHAGAVKDLRARRDANAAERLAARTPAFAVGAARLREESVLTILEIVRNAENSMDTGATLTSKGQTTIPKQIRDSLGMKAGDPLTFTLMPDGIVLMRVKSKSVMNLAGRLRKKGRRPVPI
jgi:antitoxin PrlF